MIAINKQLYLSKMQAALDKDNIAHYYIDDIYLNDYLGGHLKIEYLSEIRCISCHRKTNKSFNQGYCFVCMRNLAACDICIIKPELCHYHHGTCREASWGEEHCLKPHYIYLANTSHIKVGIARKANIPMRWIDQGAVQALPILQVNQRLLSGLIEVELKKHISDKTHWQAMLKGQPESLDLKNCRDQLLTDKDSFVASIKKKYGSDAISSINSEVHKIHYPVLTYPQKIKSYHLDKAPCISGKIMGIKGQYMMLDTGVINLRKFAGYLCQLTIE